jgi:hypothetical protein
MHTAAIAAEVLFKSAAKLAPRIYRARTRIDRLHTCIYDEVEECRVSGCHERHRIQKSTGPAARFSFAEQ